MLIGGMFFSANGQYLHFFCLKNEVFISKGFNENLIEYVNVQHCKSFETEEGFTECTS